MTFAFPLALFGFLTVPALVAIYWLRSRHKRRTVSSLMFWVDQRRTTEGGLIVDRLQTPILFFLELLALILITLAAAGPLVRAGSPTTHLVIVLDNSFSMLAGGENSPRSKGQKAIVSELNSDLYSSIHMVLAGEKPQLVGEAIAGQDPGSLLANWRCFSPRANIDDAAAFAFTLAGDRGRVLVVTDHPPQSEITESRLVWRAFGNAQPNFAFVTATRTHRDNEDRCLLEVTNLSGSHATTRLVVDYDRAGESNRPAAYDLDLGPRQTYRALLRLPSGSGVLRARLNDDPLSVDNEIILLPHPENPVRVKLAISSENLRSLVEKAVTAGKAAEIVDNAPDLLVTDGRETMADSPVTWVLHVSNDSNAESFAGPFVVKRNHPLTEGLSLGGVIWGAARSSEQAGSPVVTAGNVGLLMDVMRAGGAHDLRMRFRPEMSTLQDTPNWPVLFWNLIDWRLSNKPGIRETNLRLGSEVRIIAPPGATAVTVRSPNAAAQTVPVSEGSVNIGANEPGVHQVKAGTDSYEFAVNALGPEESDLTLSASGKWGDWPISPGELEHRSVSWLFLLMALLVLAAHVAIAARRAAPVAA